MEVGKTPSSPAPVFPHAPKPLQGIAVGATASRQEMQPKPRLPVGQRRRPLVCTVDATPVDDHHHLFPALAQERPDVMDILPQPFGIKLGDHLIEDCRGAILARAQDAEQHAIRHPAPTPIATPCETVAEPPGLSSPCTMKCGKGLLPAFGVGFTPHIQRKARTDLLVRPHPVDTFLHLAIAPVAPLHRVRGGGQQLVIEKCEGLFQGGGKEFLQVNIRLTHIET